MLIQVGKFGSDAEEIRVSSGDTVGDALSASGIIYNHERLLVTGEEANINDELEDELTAARASNKELQAYKEYADKLIAAIQKAMNNYEYSVYLEYYERV